MYCTNCGKEIKEGERFCTACGFEQISQTQDLEKSVSGKEKAVLPVADLQNGKFLNEENENTYKIPKRTYEFVSSIFMCARLLYRGRIYSSIAIAGEKMSISVDPEKKNIYPSIYLSDIIDVDVSFTESNYCLYGAVFIAVAGVFYEPLYCFVMALFVFWLGTNWKITIQMKNGRDANIYSSSKRRANQFKDELLKMLKG